MPPVGCPETAQEAMLDLEQRQHWPIACSLYINWLQGDETNWKFFVPHPIRRMWHTFSVSQRCALISWGVAMAQDASRNKIRIPAAPAVEFQRGPARISKGGGGRAA